MHHSLLIILSVVAEPNNEAERLFRQMQQALSQARTLDCVFEVKAEVGNGNDFRGRLLLAEGNRMHLQMEGQRKGALTKMAVISDGTKLVAETGGARKELPNVPKSLNQEIVTVMTQAGGRMLARGVIVPEAPEGQEAKGKRFADRLRASGFKLGRKEKLNERDAQVIEYKLQLEGEDDSPAAALWLDTQTNLPIKRTFTDTKSGKLVYTETYPKITLGRKDRRARVYTAEVADRTVGCTTAEADTGRHPGFPIFNVLAGARLSLTLAFGQTMARQVSDHCSSCGLAFIIGPLWVDYIEQLQKRGLRRTLNFDYRFYNLLFEHAPHWGPDEIVTLADCDSVFLGDIIDPEMKKCPKCGASAFLEVATGSA
jgi:outer membrane lipoprotein-sorting protein